MSLKTVLEILTTQKTAATWTNIDELITQGIPLLFNQFPIYDESHRMELEQMIVRRYLFREICTTPFYQWLFLFQSRLNEIMPKYNQLYKALASVNNLFNDTAYTRVYDEQNDVVMKKGTSETSTGDSNTTVNGSVDSNNTVVETHANTPQTQLDSFLDNQYMSSADKSTDSGGSTSEQTSEMEANYKVNRSGQDEDNRTVNANESITGKRSNKSYAEMINEYKNNLFSVDQMIIDDLEILFFSVY